MPEQTERAFLEFPLYLPFPCHHSFINLQQVFLFLLEGLLDDTGIHRKHVQCLIVMGRFIPSKSSRCVRAKPYAVHIPHSRLKLFGRSPPVMQHFPTRRPFSLLASHPFQKPFFLLIPSSAPHSSSTLCWWARMWANRCPWTPINVKSAPEQPTEALWWLRNIYVGLCPYRQEAETAPVPKEKVLFSTNEHNRHLHFLRPPNHFLQGTKCWWLLTSSPSKTLINQLPCNAHLNIFQYHRGKEELHSPDVSTNVVHSK